MPLVLQVVAHSEQPCIPARYRTHPGDGPQVVATDDRLPVRRPSRCVATMGIPY